MTTYEIRIRLTANQLRTLIEQCNTDGQRLERVAATLIGDDPERLAAYRDQSPIEQFAQRIRKLPPAPQQDVERDRLRRRAGIPAPLKQRHA